MRMCEMYTVHEMDTALDTALEMDTVGHELILAWVERGQPTSVRGGCERGGCERGGCERGGCGRGGCEIVRVRERDGWLSLPFVKSWVRAILTEYPTPDYPTSILAASTGHSLISGRYPHDHGRLHTHPLLQCTPHTPTMGSS